MPLWRIWFRLGIQDVRLRFRRSILGIGWIFLNLAVMVLAVGYVYGNLLGQDMHTFIPYLTVGLVVWGYLTSAIVEGGNAFVASEGYIKQISLPNAVYVLRVFVSITLTAAVTLCAYVAVALAYAVPLGLGTLWALPGLLALAMVALLLVSIFAHLHARFRDAAQIGGIAMQVGFYVTPVIFPAELLQQRGLNAIVDFNPLYHVLEVVRWPLLAARPAAALNYCVTGVVLALLIATTEAIGRTLGRRIVFFL